MPRTVVEKVDPEFPSYGEVPGTSAYLQRQMDAAPDVIVKVPDPEKRRSHTDKATNKEGHSQPIPIPETIITRVDTEPAHGDDPGTEAHEDRAADALPDVVGTNSGAGNSSARNHPGGPLT